MQIPIHRRNVKNGHTRGKKHMLDYRSKTDGSVLWKHCVQEHESKTRDFEMTIVDHSGNDPTMRQILEAVRIQKVPKMFLMNSKSEWNSARIPRVKITTDDK